MPQGGSTEAILIAQGTSMKRTVTFTVERFPLAKPFVIARGSRTEAVVVTAVITQGEYRGWGECVPYARYGESVETVLALMHGIGAQLEDGLDRQQLQAILPAGAARNAIDCALWDLEAKRLRVPAYELAGLHRLTSTTTAFTISLGTPQAMAEAASAVDDRPLLKLKLGGEGDIERVAAIRSAVPDAMLIVDANESWTEANYDRNMDACAAAGVALVEQPLPAGHDASLAHRARPVPLCADESVHARNDLPRLRDLYDSINIKLDKTGGLTEALSVVAQAQALDFRLFVGCMVGTSLAMAPAMLLTPQAQFVDLDGPLMLAQDRNPCLHYDKSVVFPPTTSLWG